MSSRVKERFQGLNMAADTAVELGGGGVAGFIAKTSGTITITAPNGATGTVVTETILDAIPVTAGQNLPIMINFPQEGGTVTLAGGASGTLLI